MKPLIIGVAGGSGLGKTTVVNHIINSIGQDNIVLLQHDSYYRDLKHLSFEERSKQNFDHPASLESELMIRHIKKDIRWKFLFMILPGTSERKKRIRFIPKTLF